MDAVKGLPRLMLARLSPRTHVASEVEDQEDDDGCNGQVS